MRLTLIICAVLLSGCAGYGEAPSAGDHIFAGALGFNVKEDGTWQARSYSGRYTPSVDYSAPPDGHENDGFHSYWSPQTGPVTCNTFGTFTNCN